MFAQSMNPRGSLSECRSDRLSPIARARHVLGTRYKYIKHKERVRKIVVRAQAKLRKFARLEDSSRPRSEASGGGKEAR